MNKIQYFSMLFLTVFTVWFSWVVLELLVFAYDEFNPTKTYAIIDTIKYLRVFPSLILLMVALIYSFFIGVILKILFRKLKTMTLLQFCSLVLFWVFFSGMIGSYQGIRDYQVRKCNANIDKCLQEEALKYK